MTCCFRASPSNALLEVCDMHVLWGVGAQSSGDWSGQRRLQFYVTDDVLPLPKTCCFGFVERARDDDLMARARVVVADVNARRGTPCMEIDVVALRKRSAGERFFNRSQRSHQRGVVHARIERGVWNPSPTDNVRASLGTWSSYSLLSAVVQAVFDVCSAWHDVGMDAFSSDRRVVAITRHTFDGVFLGGGPPISDSTKGNGGKKRRGGRRVRSKSRRRCRGGGGGGGGGART